MSDSLSVNVDDTIAGKIVKTTDKFIFSYDDSAGGFISLTMPIRAEQYINNALHPIFEMHLPEGYLLSVIKKHFSKLTKTDDFGLLQLMSPHINGKITYTTTPKNSPTYIELDELLHPTSTNLFDELVAKFALSSTLSGVQPKVLATIQNKATLRLDEYIVKSWGEDYPQLALNEFYCMKIVQYANIQVPEFYLAEDDKLFIMKRFDILEDNQKLGFEDMCVLQAKQRDDKYNGTYEQIAKSINIFVSPKNKKESLREYFKIMVINTIIQNGDAHLKNFGLLYDDIEKIRL